MSPSRSRSTSAALAVALCAVLVLLASLVEPGAATTTKLQQAKRDYDNYGYYVVELDPSLYPSDAPVERIAEALEVQHVERVGELPDHYLLRAPLDSIIHTQSASGALRERDEVAARDTVVERYHHLKRSAWKRQSAHDHALNAVRSLKRQIPKKRVKRDLPVLPPESQRLENRQAPVSGQVATNIRDAIDQFTIVDPLFTKQWHLVNGNMPENSINVTGVWADGVKGKGVNVAIVDDGLDMHSDDLAGNFHPDGSWDYNDHTALPAPRLADDQHGTRCAGEIAAIKNDVCGVGVAHEAGVAGIRILSASISDADEAAALNYGYQTNDIYSCSWGPPDDGRSMEAPDRIIMKAMLNGVQNGRAGKGSIFVFASGNGGAVDDQCNFDGYTNSLLSITVGAIDRKGLHPYYSEACSAIMVVTYSSGSGDNIHTTDVGKATCTDRHGGTSAAAPIAAGIFALALEVRPELTWRDMQHLCVQTAVQFNPQDPDWQMTPSGRFFNHKYGFGKLDAWAIVNAAKTWELVKPQAWWASHDSVSNQAITAAGTTATIEVTEQDLKDSNFEKLEHITVAVWAKHQRRGNIEVELDSPNGMKSILARPRRFDEDPNGMPGWVFMTVKHWDEHPIGTWTLRVRDRQTNGKTGTFQKWSMTFWGSSIDASKARPYQLPADWDYPPRPVESVTSTKTKPTPVVPVKPPVSRTKTSKTFAKPTAHLPDDHAEAEGEAHKPFGDHPTSLPATPEETSSSNSGHELQTPGYLDGIKSLVGQSPTWLFVAAGSVIIFVAGVSAFFLIRRRRRRRGMGGDRRGGGYDFAPMTDEEDVPMSSLGRTGIHLGGDRSNGGGRTKDLYDAFALNDSEDDESDGELDRERDSERARLRPDAYEDDHTPYADESEQERYMDESEREQTRTSSDEQELLGPSSPRPRQDHLD